MGSSIEAYIQSFVGDSRGRAGSESRFFGSILEPLRHGRLSRAAMIVLAAGVLGCGGSSGSPRPEVDFTWLGVTNWLMETPVGDGLLDAFVSRPPYGPSGPNAEGLELFRRFEAAAKPSRPIRWIVVGHSHFDHALDVGPLAIETGASVIGSRTTCLIAESQGLAPDRCAAVSGGERIDLDPRLELRVARVPHSSPDSIGRFAEISAPPENALGTPNGGNLAFLFRLRGSRGETALSWLFSNSIAPIDSDDGSGVNFVAAVTALLADAEPPDLWLGAPFGGRAGLDPYFDLIRPGAFVPHHWDGLMQVLADGVPSRFASPELEESLAARGADFVVQEQYLEKFILDRDGVRREPNLEVRAAVGVPTS